MPSMLQHGIRLHCNGIVCIVLLALILGLYTLGLYNGVEHMYEDMFAIHWFLLLIESLGYATDLRRFFHEELQIGLITFVGEFSQS